MYAGQFGRKFPAVSCISIGQHHWLLFVYPPAPVGVTEQLVNGCGLRRVLSVAPTRWKGTRRKEKEGERRSERGRGEIGSPTHTHNAVQLHRARTQIEVRHHAYIDEKPNESYRTDT